MAMRAVGRATPKRSETNASVTAAPGAGSPARIAARSEATTASGSTAAPEAPSIVDMIVRQYHIVRQSLHATAGAAPPRREKQPPPSGHSSSRATGGYSQREAR